MGRLEKIVVVVVLFLVAVILGISLSNDGVTESGGPVADPGRRGPRSAERSADELASRSRDEAQPGEGATPGGLLNSAGTPADRPAPNAPANEPANVPANVPNGGAPSPAPKDAGAPAVSPAPNGATPAPIQPRAEQPPQPQPLAPQYLVSREGLEPTASDELMLYTWKAGDTFKGVSEKYYGSGLHVARVRAANEGRKEETLVAGDRILISVAPAAAADRIARNATKEASTATTAWAGGLYTVGAGDVLSTISQKVYGTSKSWKKIHDANRDVIGDDPDKLKVGSRLRIPE
jgi:nucleoid-associated protein YgaU